jgi:hypothetical protein
MYERKSFNKMIDAIKTKTQFGASIDNISKDLKEHTSSNNGNQLTTTFAKNDFIGVFLLWKQQ